MSAAKHLAPLSIAEEAAACRAAWAAAPGATHGAHIHHEIAYEALTEPIEKRIAYILRKKPEHEHALRLRLMRPATAPAGKAYGEAVATARKACDEALATAHRLICSVDGCPFDGRTIFPEAKGGA